MLKNMLKRLGWPADHMSFKEITQELHRRWFQEPTVDLPGKKTLGAASAAGIVFALASEGNLKALSWTEPSADLPEDTLLPEEKALFFRDSKVIPYPHPDRRKVSRIPGKDVVCWSIPEKECGTGWLVDYSSGGIAFITEQDRSLRVGTDLFAKIQSRANNIMELGAGTVVRLETLTPDLSLVCLRLGAQQPEQIQ
ncbi:MAG: hypothetical protein COS92_01265 [Desulfobacterales bacterium CG07_land_8_20_14_0_80_52_14]|nr:MAG: hypothetical protein COX20_12225 [Desulfobacterales bacterium CG23_combo_of_CG06-09_8_20_14_all_52_9]PIU50462.1 MAG: hypothetical protein COS92_01265 [Desulfobacterales bacterium CG07_land_8_20_14_0_80_52_14]